MTKVLAEMLIKKSLHACLVVLFYLVVSCAASHEPVNQVITKDSELDVSKYTKANAMDHVVLVVFENRSFDNLLGQLYEPNEVPNFDGVLGKKLSNPIPAWAKHGADKKTVPFHSAVNMYAPDPDPGEWYAHTNTQLYNVISKNNKFKADNKIKAPWNAPRANIEPNMDGFVTDYISTFTAEMGRQPTYEEYAQIMSGYNPSQLPVISSIARGFGTFDHWYSEVPSQTFANRSFWTSATSSGLVKNSVDFIKQNDGETIFERLDAHGKTWKIYVSDGSMVSLQALIHSARLRSKFATNVVPFSKFEEDVKNGTLPDFAFIEPNLAFRHNDYHPSISKIIKNGKTVIVDASVPVVGGEKFLGKIYEDIKNSHSSKGSNYLNTALFIGFDEPGGTYDHVAPPKVVSPECGHPAGQFGFTFERSGYRVPAIIVSPWISEKTVLNAEYRHTSMIATLRKVWGLGEPLTMRDAHANTFEDIFTLDTPRLSDTWPEVHPRDVNASKRDKESFDQFDRNLSGLGLHIKEIVIATAKAESISLKCEKSKSEHDSVACIREFSAKLFPQLYKNSSPLKLNKKVRNVHVKNKHVAAKKAVKSTSHHKHKCHKHHKHHSHSK